MKLISTLTLIILFAFNLSSQTCGVIYVTNTGTGIGTPTDPTSLANALIVANANDVIRISVGTYNIDNPLNLIGDITLEGGFNPLNGWSKTSLAGATTINRTTQNPEGPANASRLVAFYGNGISNFRLQDLTITTSDAIQNGGSTYAIHLNNCSDYTIARCQLLPGNARKGDDGINGDPGAIGSNGQNGGNGNSDNQNQDGFGGMGGAGAGTGGGSAGIGALANGGCCSTGSAGSSGGTSTDYQSGGGGAGGASGGQEDRDGGFGGAGGGNTSSGLNTCGGGAGQESGCNSVQSSCNAAASGDDGCDGANGVPGMSAGLGPNGSFAGGFWIPGAQAGAGTVGQGGQGGRGGGGGAGEGGTFCTDGAGAGGGGGAGGGQGGFGGTGGLGGGSSFGLFLYNNGANSVIVQCNVNAGTAGAGGSGGSGGQGGQGGIGGQGGTDAINDFESGCGGDGGNGGRGGDGGDGGNGTSGQSIDVYLNSGSAPAQNENAFNLAAQPEIIKDSVSCANKTISFENTAIATGSGVTSWDFDIISNAANPSTGTNNPDTTIYSTAGRYTLTNDGNTYEGFVFVTPEQTVDAGLDQNLCDNMTTTLVGATSGTNVMWSSMGAATIDDATNITTGVQNLQPGENKFVLTAGDCCPADPDTISIILGVSNTGTDLQTACNSYTWIDGNTYTSDNNTATHVLTNVSGCDSTVTLDLTINNATSGTDTQTACESFDWIDGNTYTSNNNSATYTLTNAAGCDSIVTLDLTITNSSAGTDTQIACDSYDWIDGNTYTVDNNTATYVLTNAAGCDSTVTLDLTIIKSTAGTDTQTACDSFTWIDGNTYTMDNNSATYVLTNAAGCDSTVTLDLTINNADISVTNNSPTLTANASSATFQWVSCDENYNPITGETNASYTAVGNGSYAVIVTQNGCTDTSACETVANIGLEDLKTDDLSVFPNPTNGKISISHSSIIRSIKVSDPTGRIVIHETPNQKESSLDLGSYYKGAYMIEINVNGGVIRRKVIKQ